MILPHSSRGGRGFTAPSCPPMLWASRLCRRILSGEVNHSPQSAHLNDIPPTPYLLGLATYPR